MVPVPELRLPAVEVDAVAGAAAVADVVAGAPAAFNKGTRTTGGLASTGVRATWSGEEETQPII
jgi:hypothetical protein